MGYSIAVPVRSKKLQAEMMEFLEENFKSWSDLDEKAYYPNIPVTEEHLAYDDGKCRIGFNYGAGTGCSEQSRRQY